MGVQKFEDLIAWQKAYELCLEVCKIVVDFPKEEQFGLAAHLRKTAISCPSNIAEGFERRNKREFDNFIRISLGSLAELKTQLLISRDLNYIPSQKYTNLEIKLVEVMKLLYGLRKSLN